MQHNYGVPVEELVARFKKLYSGIVADAMDRKGLRNQLLPSYLRPLTDDTIVAGPAFTGQGMPVDDSTYNDNDIRFAMLESIKPYDIAVWATGNSGVCAHWGGLMTRSTRQAGGAGAIIDGGIRDVKDIIEQDFPVFYKFYSCGSSIGRWAIKSYQEPIDLGGVHILPGDFVFGDIDGVVTIPRDRVVEILQLAEDMFNKENLMGADMIDGMRIRDAYAKYGTI